MFSIFLFTTKFYTWDIAKGKIDISFSCKTKVHYEKTVFLRLNFALRLMLRNIHNITQDKTCVIITSFSHRLLETYCISSQSRC